MSADQWSVAVYEPNDRFHPHTDYIWVVVDKLSEAAARQTFASRVNTARSLGFKAAELRSADSVIQRWP